MKSIIILIITTMILSLGFFELNKGKKIINERNTNIEKIINEIN